MKSWRHNQHYYKRVTDPFYGGRVWKEIIKFVKQRDGYKCKKCGMVGRNMEVDHINPRKKGGMDTPDNLQTLCKSCHSKKTRYENG